MVDIVEIQKKLACELPGDEKKKTGTDISIIIPNFIDYHQQRLLIGATRKKDSV